jgi:ketosteroid isomerase-like protein
VLRALWSFALAAALHAALTLDVSASRQNTDILPLPLRQMVETERAFAARARVVGWKQAFLEYFAEAAVGFDGDAGPAKDQIRGNPDPPRDLQLLWEPRYGDIAASGDLGYLTGPVTTINPARNGGMPRHSTYASVWKRQPDGTFKVVMDVGITTPDAVPFAPGFTRAPFADRYTGTDTADAATRSLRSADEALTKAAMSGQAEAYRGRIADRGRIHRPDVMPLVGEAASLAWLRTQPPYASGATRYAEVARLRDIGYTWGSYAVPQQGTGPAARGFYTRVWVRSRDGSWKVALDVLQPQQ